MRIARAATLSIGLAAFALSSTAGATIRPSDSVVAATEAAAADFVLDREGSPIATSEELSKKNRTLAVILLFLIGLGIGLAAIGGEESP